MQVVELLRQYRQINVRIELIELEIEGLKDARVREKIEEVDNDGLKAVTWDRGNVTGGKEKHGDDKFFNLAFNKEHDINIESRIKKIESKIGPLKYQESFINGLVGFLDIKSAFIIKLFYFDGYNCAEISKKYCDMFTPISLRGIEKKKKVAVKELQKYLDNYVKR